MEKLNREKAILVKDVEEWTLLNQKVEDNLTLLEMVVEEDDEDGFAEIQADVAVMQKLVRELELKQMLSGETDSNNVFLSINSGAGGTEAADWCYILRRMYVKYAEKKGYKVEELEVTEGEEAGLKSVTLLIQGPFAYGHIKAESGVHRLVRISPFDSNARRHTSFASVFAWAEVDDDIQVDINTEDLRIDTYRASGAGGQHVNRTDSAVRITHIPTGIVVQCQNQRSQHANRDRAMKMLASALYEKEVEEKNKEKEKAHSEKMANEWGSQIRSYVLHPYQMVKDHRTSTESGNPSNVLDGDLDNFIEAYLKFSTKGNELE